MRLLLFCFTALVLTATACESPNRVDNLAPVDRDEDQFPGNDNELSENALDPAEEVGSVNSYANVPEGEDDDGEYDNVFRRSAADADNAVVTDNDLDMPHDGTAGRTGVPSAAGGGIDGDDGIEDRGRDYLEYGSGRSTDEVNGAQPGAQESGVPEGGTAAMPGRTAQADLGAQGARNYVLEEYYGEAAEDYGYQSDGDATGNSWIRPLDPAEKNYSEQVVRVGSSQQSDSYMARYEELKDRLYNIPENQQALVYAPNNYTVEYIRSWDGDIVAATSDGEAEADYGKETAYDRVPLMGSGCEQADDPAACSSAALDKELRDFLNDPRVLREMQRSGVDGVDFEVDEDGKVIASSVSAHSAGKACSTDECNRFNRTLGRVLSETSWQAGVRQGRPTVSRVKLPLRYQQTEELQDLSD